MEAGEGTRSATVAAALAPLAVPGIIALSALAWVWDAVARASWAALGRDQGIFQYLAWAVRTGDVAYRDARDVNGPVITMIHAAFQVLGGEGEHRFRVLDLACTGLSFAIAGALVPSIASARPVRPHVRAAWALASWAALSAQYLTYGFWDTAQRESFLDWFVLMSLALQAATPVSARPRSRLALAAAGLLSLVPWLGKPTFALFTVAQVLAIVLEPGRLRDRAARLGPFAMGGAIGLALPLAWLALEGDVRAWAELSFVDVPTTYRFIWSRPAWVILSMTGYSRVVWSAALTTVGLLVLVALRRLPLRAVPMILMPVLGLGSVVLQAKGFPYHFHPVSLGTTFGWLLGLAAVSEFARGGRRSALQAGARGAAIAGALLVGAHAAFIAWRSPFPPAPTSEAEGPMSIEGDARLAAFERIDFFPSAMRDAASFVAHATASGDRVQLYGMDPYLLFLAGRRSATPYVYAYDLNADAALHGSFEPGGLVPTADERARIRERQGERARDLLVRIERVPPAAFVFVDRSPLLSEEDAFADFSRHCPEAAAWVEARYVEAADFDGFHVWLPLARLAP